MKFGPEAIITNPPFSIACEFASACIGTGCPYIALLLRLNVLGSNPWAKFWIENSPTAIRTLRKRPSFSGDGSTDACNYAWFIWEHAKPTVDVRPI